MGVLDGKVALVTGASRGVGKGVALALGEAGAIVYVTGRSRQEGDAPLPGTIDKTVEEIAARGGKAIAVPCDHRNDDEVESLIAAIVNDQGRIDILVNNVFAVPDDLIEAKPFWERPLSHWDDMIDLGLRAHYVAARAAAPHMVGAGQGLIVNISSPGARCYIHSAIYGIGKAGADKMAADMAKELRDHGVAALSLWLGIVKTERTTMALEAAPEAYAPLMDGLESPEYPGRIIAALYENGQVMARSGQAWYTSELGAELKIEDVDGRIPASYREMLGGPAAPNPAMIS
ncbi:MAG: SDR family NAD(P)-dependent oxidoreductase [Alphaproteobacteria bacterium]